jgi:hypothetical protein
MTLPISKLASETKTAAIASMIIFRPVSSKEFDSRATPEAVQLAIGA